MQGGQKDTVQVTMAALTHDDLSMFTCPSVPSYFMLFRFSLRDLILDEVSRLAGSFSRHVYRDALKDVVRQ